MNVPKQIWTIGHSNQSIEAFIGLLTSHHISALADVRLLPGSRKHPQFNAEALEQSLADVGISYHPFPELGGRRRPRPDSPNTAWRNASFRGYADYMDSPEWRGGLERLERLACERKTAVMCAETLWWKCHRALISDFEKARGVEVLHILSDNKVEEHPYTSAAQLIDGRLSYAGGGDATQPELLPV